MTDHDDILNDIKLRLGNPDDFASLQALREEVFCDELGIQERSYHDVISDWHSKNVLLLSSNRLIGAVRLAYMREWQEYYVSYLCLRKQYRKKALLRLLFGAVILLMRHNGINSIRADSSDVNLPMYRAMGCVAIGPRFRKSGFVCEWTPMRYRLGINAAAEQNLAERTTGHFERGMENNLAWEFDAVFHLCGTMAGFRRTFDALLEKNLVPGHVPHLSLSRQFAQLPYDRAFISRLNTTEASSHEIDFRSDDISITPAPLSCSDQSTEWRNDRFSDLNSTLPRKHLLMVLAGSDAAPLARLYAILTCKYLIELASWDEAPHLCQLTTGSLTAIIGPADALPPAAVLSALQRDCSVGLLTAPDLPSLSSALLGSYFHFIGPTQSAIAIRRLDHGNGAGAVEAHSRAIDQVLPVTACGSDRVSIVLSPHHSVIVPAEVCRAAAGAISASLRAGCTIGQSVRDAGIELGLNRDAPMLLIGDPILRLNVATPETSVEDMRQLTVVSG
ncbi:MULTISPECIES: GNAT family N-acetyltransferase [unclassified Bradyrhizobium]|uniref:GNAT family N-acetyltransferase n=1 Tax=unclassified Bradyrhizobium TaxID=2631580 RepID=UPI002915D9CB|nr:MULTISPECIES: GNAT family N-acetyltransferase [unclassified Bradyrhizobium]